MTQPPEPGRPPQGDGGAHDPTQVSFGKSPSQPPPPPAPGAPEPGTPPYAQAAAGYGYPQTPPAPNPYLQQPSPQAPPAAPQYGYPAQHMAPTVPQPAAQPLPRRSEAERKALRAQVAIVVSALVAIALIIGGGVWYSGSKDDRAPVAGGSTDGDGKGGGKGGGTEKAPSDPSAKLLFELDPPKVGKDLQITVAGSWITEDAYVKSGVAEINAYGLDDGAKKWTLPLPGPVCETSRHTTRDGRTAIVHEPDMPTARTPTHGCSEVTAIDLTTGKKLWTKNAKNGDRPVRFDNVTLSGTTVAAGSSHGGAAWDLADGTSLWQPKAADECQDAGYGGGKALVAVRRCGSYDARQLHIQTIDAKKGTVVSEYKMPQGVEYASVVSTDPLVVAADVGDTAGDGSGISDFFSVDAVTGKLRAKISAPGDTYAADCDGITRVEHCTGLAVTGDRLFLPTEEHDTGGEGGRSNEIIAIDLATGRTTGQKADAGDNSSLYPLRADGDNLIAYKRPPYDKGGQIVSIGGAGFEQTVLLELPADDKSQELELEFSPEYQEYLFSGGRLFMSQVYVRQGAGADEVLAVAYGPKG
ncbi:PQQ-binding-like beta-propeller repeat protein [Streptomyces chilikensis]|uniref:outer membrane protein assembly factor BamB family protein n=1 Tax=Streptomyces chilikensis TaxID=1194079 RepID=UPI00140D5DDC|nr:PQQ-binding-like beta-propeller repeat protein [Streptomyces chilikensis]